MQELAPSLTSHADAQEQNNLLNYPSQSIRSGVDAARNYLQLHLLVALCLLVVDILATGLFVDGQACGAALRSWQVCRYLFLSPYASHTGVSKQTRSLTRASLIKYCPFSTFSVLHIHWAGAFAGRGPPVANVSIWPVASGMSSSARVFATAGGVSQMKMAPSVPAVTMNFWLGAMAIYTKDTQRRYQVVIFSA